MSEMPKEFQSTDIDTLTYAARDHLSRVLGNQAVQKQQQQATRGQPLSTPAPAPSPTPAPPNNGTTPPPLQITPAPARAPGTSPTTTPLQPYQKEICREIGFNVHTQERINYWQALAGPHLCYFHCLPHPSSSCSRLNQMMENVRNGTPPVSRFIPNPLFQSPPNQQQANPTPLPAPAPSPAPSPALSPAPAPSPAPSLAPNAAARHVTASVEEDSDNSTNGCVEINDSNYDAGYYTASHNCSSPTISPMSSPSPQFCFIVDSGATHHMLCI